MAARCSFTGSFIVRQGPSPLAIPWGLKALLRDRDACFPPRRSAVGRWFHLSHCQASAGEQPCDHRVGVPHVPTTQQIPTPDVGGDGMRELENAPSLGLVATDALRAVDGLGGVCDIAVHPAADLVPKHAEPTKVGAPHRPFHRYAARWPLRVWDRPTVLDHEPAFGERHLEGRVIQIEHPSVLDPGTHPLVQTPVETYEPTARAEREPIEVDAHRPSISAASGPHRRGSLIDAFEDPAHHREVAELQ